MANESTRSTIAEQKGANFVSYIPDYETVLRNPFKKWADKVLPHIGMLASTYSQSRVLTMMVIAPEPKVDLSVVNNLDIRLSHDSTGLPLLPSVDAETLALKDVRQLLSDYFDLCWSNLILFALLLGLT